MNLCVIPARGGSQRIPRKNVRLFHGKPIIAYSIEAAWASGLFERVVVSTDDDEIANISASFQATVHRRPVALALDSTGTLEVVAEAARKFSGSYEYAFVCGVYATAPMLRPADIVRGFDSLRWCNQWATHCISVGIHPLRDAAQFYWSTSVGIRSECPYYTYTTCVEPIDENRICDINVEVDWVRAESMYAALHPEVT